MKLGKLESVQLSLLPGGSFLDEVASFMTPLHGHESLVFLQWNHLVLWIFVAFPD